MKTESESLYGSSIYRDGQIVDDADLPEYAQLCRRLFPTLMSEENDNAGPEAEENLARYMKYLTGLPLPSLKIEPALLQSDIQRISNELTMLLLNEATNPHKNDHLQKNTQKGSQQSFKHQLSRQTGDSDQGSEIGDIYEEGAVPQNASSVNSGGDDEPHIFNVVYETGKAAAAATEKLNANLNEAQKSLSQLEAACGMFSMEMSELDQRAKIIQRVLDKQDIIMRIIELPRVMQMCVAGGYYEEAVEIAEHVRVTGDRLISDIRDGVRILPGSLDEGSVIVTSTAASREQLVNFVSTIQKQVHAEFENMVVDLCKELGYTRLASTISTQLGSTAGSTTNPGLDISSYRSGNDSVVDSSKSSYEKSIKRLSQVAKIVAILRGIGIFTEAELRMLYLRSRWQAWLQTAETLSGFAPSTIPAGTDAQSTTNLEVQKESSATNAATTITSAPSFSPSKSRLQRASERNTASTEVAAYLAKCIDTYMSWLAEADMQYKTLFVLRPTAEMPQKQNPNNTAAAAFTDLAIFSSQHFLSSYHPLFDLLTEASSVSNLQSLVSAHAHKLVQSNIDFVTPFLEQQLGERAFVSVVCGIEEAVADACQTVLRISKTLSSKIASATRDSTGAQVWDQLAVSTRPSLALPPSGFNVNYANDPSKFLGQYRVSPVGLLQYPILAQLLHAFRDCLHALRILVLAGDSSGSRSNRSNEVLVLLTMTSIVLESELARIAEALAGLCVSALQVPSELHSNKTEQAAKAASDKSKETAIHVCVAFVFGLVRSVAEIFEEVASLSETASTAGLCASAAANDGESPVTLFSETTYNPLLAYLP